MDNFQFSTLVILYDIVFAGVINLPRTESMNRAIKKYEKEKVDHIYFRVPKGKKELLQQHAAAQGESLSAFLNRAVDEAVLRDKKKD